MASLAGKLRQLNLRLQNNRSPERGYGEALVRAIADMDTRIEAEALKCFGDLYLERGKCTKSGDDFDKAAAMYTACIVSCPDPDMTEAISDRLRYMDKIKGTFLRKVSRAKRVERESQMKTSNRPAVSENNTLRVTEICQAVDAAVRRTSTSVRSLRQRYAQVLVDAVSNRDPYLETEVLKTLGDSYLVEGKSCTEVSKLSKAFAFYYAALTKCTTPCDRQTLLHRVRYNEKVREFVRKRLAKRRISRPGGEKQAVRKDTKPDVKQDSHTDVRRSYRTHLQQGDRALQTGDLDMAEQHFASALKLVHQTKPTQPGAEAHCLHKLGDVYIQRGKRTEDGGDFTKAAALYNAAMARSEAGGFRDMLAQALKQTEQFFLRHVGGVACEIDQYDVDMGHKNEMRETRGKVTERLETIDQRYNPYTHDQNDPEVRNLETARATAVMELFQEITHDRKTFVDRLISECVGRIGQPPCRYAFIGLGSQATELVTPFSDLEFAILIEDGADYEQNKQYFRNLTHYLHLKIINLGETILPAVGIKSLNDFYSGDPKSSWFYDSITPRGFAFDGSMPWASKTPFGRQRTKDKPPLELIQTPGNMAKFQEIDIAVAEGYHLARILRSACHMTGDMALFEEYMNIMAQTTHHVDPDGNVDIGHITTNIREFGSQQLSAQL
ncbi:hypothetical protein Bbelb_337440 [Branchiostoma belcheri]|nr:hypothetical protein Bbelb_337440 [Branchiostoma belcheri]